MSSNHLSPAQIGSIHEGAQFQRRQLLSMLLAGPALAWATRALADQPSPLAKGDRFLTLSQFATGRSSLDPASGAAVLAALRDSDPALGAVLDDLAATAASGQYPDVEALEVAVRDTPRHAALLALVSAFYTGSVTVKGKPRVLFVTDALMYQPIADGSHIPGSCAGATNSWADRALPPLAPIPSP